MFKTKLMLTFILLISAHSMRAFDAVAFSKDLAQNDILQSFTAGVASESFAKLAVDYFEEKPIRTGSIASMIVLANLVNIFRNNDGKMRRFVSTLFGIATATFIKNEKSWLSKTVTKPTSHYYHQVIK